MTGNSTPDDPKVVLFPGRIRNANETDADLKGGGPGGTSGDMEARVARLESDMAHVKDTLKSLDGRTEAVRTGVEAIRVEMATLKTNVSHLPGKGFIFTVAAGLLAAAGGLIAAAARFIH